MSIDFWWNLVRKTYHDIRARFIGLRMCMIILYPSPATRKRRGLDMLTLVLPSCFFVWFIYVFSYSPLTTNFALRTCSNRLLCLTFMFLCTISSRVWRLWFYIWPRFRWHVEFFFTPLLQKLDFSTWLYAQT